MAFNYQYNDSYIGKLSARLSDGGIGNQMSVQVKGATAVLPIIAYEDTVSNNSTTLGTSTWSANFPSVPAVSGNRHFIIITGIRDGTDVRIPNPIDWCTGITLNSEPVTIHKQAISRYNGAAIGIIQLNASGSIDVACTTDIEGGADGGWSITLIAIDEPTSFSVEGVESFNDSTSSPETFYVPLIPSVYSVGIIMAVTSNSTLAPSFTATDGNTWTLMYTEDIGSSEYHSVYRTDPIISNTFSGNISAGSITTGWAGILIVISWS